jgi:hypothetical protein
MARAILKAWQTITERRVRRMLPPEHRIVALCAVPDDLAIEYLIEGPLLPEAKTLNPIFTMERIDSGVQLSGRWAEGGDPWLIGEWPSMDAFKEEMTALD